MYLYSYDLFSQIGDVKLMQETEPLEMSEIGSESPPAPCLLMQAINTQFD